MKTTKINLDRPKISSEEIEKKQDFQKVVKGASKHKPGVFKNPWFYGVVGACSIAVFVMSSTYNSSENRKQNMQLAQASIIQVQPTKQKLQSKLEKETKMETVKSSSTPIKRSIEISSTEIMTANTVTGGEEQPVKTTKKTQKTAVKKLLTVPNLGGVHSGSMKASELMKCNVIESGTSEPLASYMIGYFNGTTDVMEFVSGNTLSEKMKKDIIEYNTGEMIFFTEMYTTDKNGQLHILQPINIRILPN